MPQNKNSLDQWLARQERIAAQALRSVAPEFAATAQGTDAYQDDTGANRAATGSFVVGLGVDETAKAERLAREADRLNEGHAFLAAAAGPPDGIGEIITTTATDYAIDLEREEAGERSYLRNALLSEAPAARDAIATLIRRRNGGS